MNIFDENVFLIKRIQSICKDKNINKQMLIQKITDGLIPDSPNRDRYISEFIENRGYLLESLIDAPFETFKHPTSLNDICRCILKILNKRKYYKLIHEIGFDNLESNSELLCYDPSKNGQNLLKHGIEFHAVHSYCGGHFPLISPNKKGNQVLFSRYYFQNNNHMYMYREKPEKEYVFLATVFVISESKMKFITSRVIDLYGDIDSQLKLLISDSKLNEDSLILLREQALEILKNSQMY